MVATTGRAAEGTLPEPGWPAEATGTAVCLLDASAEFERRLLEAWIDRHRPEGSEVEVIDLPSSRRRRTRRIDPRLEARLNRGDDPWLLPLRVAWLPPLRRGKRTASLIDALKLGDPRDPDALRQRVIFARHPDRCVIVVAEPARANRIRAAHADAVEPEHLDRYVVRRATLALERAERRLRGNRYKVPKFVMEDITGRGSFRDELVRLAPSAGIAPERAIGRGARYLREIAATHSPYLIDIIANGIHWLYRQGYGRIDYDTEQFRQLYRLGEEHPLVFLPSHKSQLDRLSLQYSLWENDLPPNHTAGGINMNFFPVGPLVRRTGVFFIRRSFKDNAIYKWVLQSYLDYLVEKRFSIEFYIEGGRSRSGKLLPPRFGMLAYLVDSWRRGKSEDIYLIPTSIAYDQIQDVGSYAAEQRGAEKRAESFGWALGAMRQLRRRYGDIYIRFGEPVSVAKELSGAEETAEGGIDLQKLAFEVMVRINRVTPITAASLVTTTLLALQDRAATLDEITAELDELVADVEQRSLPTAGSLRLREPGEVRKVLDLLAEHDLVTRFEGGTEPLYLITPDQHIAAAFYRNTIIHHFVNGAIAEVALLGRDGSEPGAAFWEDVLELRDLLKFEFFFPLKESYLEEIRQEVERQVPGWERTLEDRDSVAGTVDQISPLRAHWALRPFLEAYQVVADILVRYDAEAGADEKQLLQECLALGKQYRMQRRIAAEESVSQLLFGNGLKLAANRGLLEHGPDVAENRLAFARQLAEVLDRVDRIAALAAGRRTRASRPPKRGTLPDPRAAVRSAGADD
jgi:glycerol-3-phosphate O-acyltransferase